MKSYLGIELDVPLLHWHSFFLWIVDAIRICSNDLNKLIWRAPLCISFHMLYSKFLCTFRMAVKGVSIVSDISDLLLVTLLFLLLTPLFSLGKYFLHGPIGLFGIMVLGYGHYLLVFMSISFHWLFDSVVFFDLDFPWLDLHDFFLVKRLLNRHQFRALSLRIFVVKTHNIFFRLLLLFCLIRILDELFLLADYFEQNIHVFEVRNREVPHKVFSIQLGDLSCWLILKLNYTSVMIMALGCLNITHFSLHWKGSFTDININGRKWADAVIGAESILLLFQRFFTLRLSEPTSLESAFIAKLIRMLHCFFWCFAIEFFFLCIWHDFYKFIIPSRKSKPSDPKKYGKWI